MPFPFPGFYKFAWYFHFILKFSFKAFLISSFIHLYSHLFLSTTIFLLLCFYFSVINHKILGHFFYFCLFLLNHVVISNLFFFKKKQQQNYYLVTYQLNIFLIKRVSMWNCTEKIKTIWNRSCKRAIFIFHIFTFLISYKRYPFFVNIETMQKGLRGD